MRLVMVSARRGRSLKSVVQLKLFVLWLHYISAGFNHCRIVFVTTKKMPEDMLFSIMQPILPRATRFFPYWTLIALLGWNET